LRQRYFFEETSRLAAGAKKFGESETLPNIVPLSDTSHSYLVLPTKNYCPKNPDTSKMFFV
jgi:hypothetical protein